MSQDKGLQGSTVPICSIYLNLFACRNRAIRNETHTISIYPGLEGLGFRVQELLVEQFLV